jgi:hypothetical protein
LLDPTAPLPAGWPAGGLGAFMLFCFPVGGGIPLGVLMAQNGGVPIWGTVGLYFLSDVLLALTTEPMLALASWLSGIIPALAVIGGLLTKLSAKVGLQDEGARGPLGLVLVSFAVSPTTGRAAAAAAGHGFLPGWALAITGDMGYFGLLMASTLWLTSALGDDRLAVGLVVGVSWVLPLILRRMRKTAPRPSPVPSGFVDTPATVVPEASIAKTGATPRAKRRRKH